MSNSGLRVIVVALATPDDEETEPVKLSNHGTRYYYKNPCVNDNYVL